MEVELETTKQRNKENLQQAILVEKERLTQMQWDMEELRRKSFEMEMKLNSRQVTFYAPLLSDSYMWFDTALNLMILV